MRKSGECAVQGDEVGDALIEYRVLELGVANGEYSRGRREWRSREDDSGVSWAWRMGCRGSFKFSIIKNQRGDDERPGSGEGLVFPHSFFFNKKIDILLIKYFFISCFATWHKLAATSAKL